MSGKCAPHHFVQLLSRNSAGQLGNGLDNLETRNSLSRLAHICSILCRFTCVLFWAKAKPYWQPVFPRTILRTLVQYTTEANSTFIYAIPDNWKYI